MKKGLKECRRPGILGKKGLLSKSVFQPAEGGAGARVQIRLANGGPGFQFFFSVSSFQSSFAT